MPPPKVSHQKALGPSDMAPTAPYYHVAEQLENKQISPAEAITQAQQLAIDHPSLSALEQLWHEADEQYWYAPRHSWCLAYVAHAAAQALTEQEPDPNEVDSLSIRQDNLAHSSLILGVTLNTLGRFAEAVPLLQVAAERFLASDKPAQAVRANSELAQSYAYLGKLNHTQTIIAQAKELLARLDDALPLGNAYCQRSEGLLDLMQNRYHEAIALLRQAGEVFIANGRDGEAGLSWCDLAGTLRFVDTQKALDVLNQARTIPTLSNSPVHTARCDHIQAFIYSELNRYAESLTLQGRALHHFEQEGMEFLVACCKLEQGFAYYDLNQYEDALKAYYQGRTYFVAQAHSSYIAMCDLNIANVFYHMNHYRKALATYQRVAKEATREERILRAARCHTNMGLCYEQLNHYDKALVWHNRAYEAFIQAGNPAHIALCQENLAGTYRALGRYALALTHYQQAYETFTAENLPVYSAYCDSQMANLYLAMDQPENAYHCLEKASHIYQEIGLTVCQAICHRLLAQVAHDQGQYNLALTHLQQARKVFISQEMIIEMALSDLVEGEVKVATGEIQLAEELFRCAEAVLAPGFPDQAWRVEEGLGQCALTQNDQQTALDHYRMAATFIGQARDTLPTERLSSTFFARREYIFQTAIKLALELGETEQALALVEASKARTLLNQYRSLRLHSSDDPYLARLVEREATLRQQLETLRSQFISLKPEAKLLSTRGSQVSALEELKELSQTYEEVVDHLRLMASTTPAAPPSPFSIAAFREAAGLRQAQGNLSGNWCCLAYFLAEDQLLIFSLTADNLEVHTTQFTAHDHRILSECVNQDPEQRELIYRGTLRGFAVRNHPGPRYRQHLGRLLLPPKFLTNRPDVLILVPHGILHALPFHALFVGNALLLEYVPVLYAPSLQILQALWNSGDHKGPIIGNRSLICGVENFNERAYPLPHVAQEVQAVRNVVGGEVLYEHEATVSDLKQMSKSGTLSQFDVVHFATHAVTESAAPMLSRVLLADDDLTVVDILDLKIDARLVTLSSCQAAIGDAQAGDEMMTLARAFFYAGAKAVLASLWAVEDQATAVLMQYFYQRLQASQPIPQALRQTQIAMHRAGYSPYQWAAFIAIGQPL